MSKSLDSIDSFCMSATMVVETADPSILAKIEGQLAFMDVALMALEKDRGDSAMFKQIARSVQSIRGACRNWGLAEMELLACDLSDWLAQLRGVGVEMTDEQLVLVQRCTTAFQAALASEMQDLPVPETLRSVNDEVRRTVHESMLMTAS